MLLNVQECQVALIDYQAKLMPAIADGAAVLAAAVRLALQYAFDHLNLERVALRVQADNLRAIRAYEKAGFVREGCLRRDAYRDGAYVDVLCMGILREEFHRDTDPERTEN